MAILDKLDQLIARIGHFVSYLVLGIIAVIVYEIVARGVFSAPSAWAHDISAWLQVAFVFLGGAYALQQGQFVRIDLLFGVFPVKVKILIDATIGTLLFGLFVYVLMTRGFDFVWKSYQIGEVSMTGAWGGPVFISKALVPLGGILLTVAWISRIVRGLNEAFGSEESS